MRTDLAAAARPQSPLRTQKAACEIDVRTVKDSKQQPAHIEERLSPPYQYPFAPALRYYCLGP
jgi:hypothetical protein